MQPFLINKYYSFLIEPDKKKVRLVVLKDGAELVCRKEYINKLEAFIKLNEGVLFKGRLQLHKHFNDISIIVKDEIIGHIDAAYLTDCLIK